MFFKFFLYFNVSLYHCKLLPIYIFNFVALYFCALICMGTEPSQKSDLIKIQPLLYALHLMRLLHHH